MATSTTVSFSWTAATDNVGVKNYFIWMTYPTTQLISTLGPSVLNYTAINLTANSTYRFKIKADDDAGNMSNFSNEITCRTKV